MAPDLRTVELGLDARLIDEVLGGSAAENDGSSPGPPDHDVRRLDDVADDVDVPEARILLPGLRQAHADRRIGDRRAEDRDVGAKRRGQDAVAASRLPEMATELMQELARGVATRLERRGELGDPVVVADELF